MRPFLLAGLMLATPVFSAEQAMIAKRGDDYVRLTDKPCEVASVLRFIRPEARAQHRRADTQMSGQRYFACYVLRSANVLIIDEDGDAFAVPIAEFQPDEGV
jgi:hypothetical protein